MIRIVINKRTGEFLGSNLFRSRECPKSWNLHPRLAGRRVPWPPGWTLAGRLDRPIPCLY